MANAGEQATQHPAASSDVRREINEDIEHTLEHRSAPSGTLRGHVEDKAKRGGGKLWHGLQKRPSLGVIVFGGLAIAAADAIGVGELAMGIGIGYAAWQVLRKGKSVGEALEEAEQIERG